MKRLAVFAFVVAVIALIVFAVGKVQDMSPRHHFELGKAAYNHSAYDEAIVHFSRVIQLDSRFPLIYGWRSMCHRFRAENDLALADVTEQIQRNPNYGTLYTDRGDLYYMKGDDDRSIADYTKAIELKYKVDFNLLRRAEAYRAKKDHDRALSDFDNVLELNPESRVALIGKGQMHREKKQYDQAEASFQKAVEKFPDYPRGFNNLAWLWATCPDARFRSGAKAVAYATKANELTSWKDQNYLNTLAAAYAETGNFDEAVKWIKKALEHADPSRPEDCEQDRDALKLFESRQPYRVQ